MARPLKTYPNPKANGPLDAKKLGEWVRARRTQSGLRIDDAAELCGVSKDVLLRVETAKSGVRLESVFKVLNGLGLKLCIELGVEK